MSLVCLRGGKVVDPRHALHGEVKDLHFRDGRIVEPAPGERPDEEVDVTGHVVMAGGIDLHTHIGGGKVNLARLLMTREQRRGDEPQPLPDDPLERASCAGCTPGTLATGYRYVEMGYTAAFEPAMMACNARQTHLEMGDIPILDHGAYVMLGNDEQFLQMLSRGDDPERIRDHVAWTLHATKALGVKVVNPGGISAFKFNQRRLDVDESHVHWRVTPRQVVHALASSLRSLGVPHPLHIHASNLGVAGNIGSTIETLQALDGLPGHLTHVQFHAYGNEGPHHFSSAAARLVEALERHPQVSIDVGQIMFGQTVTASGDTMRQHAQAAHAQPRKWIGADIECEAGCGVVPFRYRDRSFVNALQWTIGLELFLTMKDPWRVVLTTDHPNGGPFTSYPHLIRLLMDRSFRNDQLSGLHPEVVAQSPLAGITRELTLSEIAIMTRAAPARLLGLRDRGHLGAGAVADVVVYRDEPDREAMFARPARVYKDGRLVAQAGRIVATPTGGTLFVEPAFDRGIEKSLRAHHARFGSVNFDHLAVGHDELCRCNHGGRLLPVACFE